ncbi:MAG TPA: hypothetical protein VFH45_11340 [Acidimicrobiales bacterium]|nr:hypothetical protein [Acidimicrobiales bacterium]
MRVLGGRAAREPQGHAGAVAEKARTHVKEAEESIWQALHAVGSLLSPGDHRSRGLAGRRR